MFDISEEDARGVGNANYSLKTPLTIQNPAVLRAIPLRQPLLHEGQHHSRR